MPPASPAIADVAAWLNDDFIASFERDVDVTIWRAPFIDHQGQRHVRGFFAITLLSLAYCEAMTGLVGPNAGTVATCQFIENVVSANSPAPSGARYSSRGTLLYNLYRHRLTHQREPGQLNLNGTIVTWSMNRGVARADHLKLSPLPAPAVNTLELKIDVEHLRDDVLATFRTIQADVLAGNRPAGPIHTRAVAMHAPQPPPPGLGQNGHVWIQFRAAIANPDP
jgi:hypothetical protein